MPNHNAASDAAIEATAQLLRVAVWAQAVGFLLFGLVVMARDSAGFLRNHGLASLAWPIVIVLLMHATRIEVVLARLLGLGFSAFLLILASLVTTVVPLAGAWGMSALSLGFPSERDVLDMDSLLAIGLYYAGALVVNVVFVLRACRVSAKERTGPAD